MSLFSQTALRYVNVSEGNVFGIDKNENMLWSNVEANVSHVVGLKFNPKWFYFIKCFHFIYW